MNTKTITQTIFSVLTALTVGSLSAATGVQKPENINPANVEFAWDLHHVVVKRDDAAMFFKSMPSWGKMLKIKLSKKKKYRIVRKKLKVLKDTAATGQAYMELFQKHGFNKLADTFRDLASLQKPTKGIKKLIQELHAMGYVQRPCSNIGSLFFKDLAAKLHDFFCYFAPGTTATYVPGRKSIIKPNPEFYETHNKKFNPNGTKTFIFVDDKLENVKAARDSGWIGIQFKNVKQLRANLIELGINVNKK